MPAWVRHRCLSNSQELQMCVGPLYFQRSPEVQRSISPTHVDAGCQLRTLYATEARNGASRTALEPDLRALRHCVRVAISVLVLCVSKGSTFVIETASPRVSFTAMPASVRSRLEWAYCADVRGPVKQALTAHSEGKILLRDSQRCRPWERRRQGERPSQTLFKPSCVSEMHRVRRVHRTSITSWLPACHCSQQR